MSNSWTQGPKRQNKDNLQKEMERMVKIPVVFPEEPVDTFGIFVMFPSQNMGPKVINVGKGP